MTPRALAEWVVLLTKRVIIDKREKYQVDEQYCLDILCINNKNQYPHMSSPSFTMSSSLNTRSPFSLSCCFRCCRVTIRLGVSGVTGVKGMYGLYGVGIPVRGPFRGFDGRSNIVVLVGGALCRGNASRKGSPP